VTKYNPHHRDLSGFTVEELEAYSVQLSARATDKHGCVGIILPPTFSNEHLQNALLDAARLVPHYAQMMLVGDVDTAAEIEPILDAVRLLSKALQERESAPAQTPKQRARRAVRLSLATELMKHGGLEFIRLDLAPAFDRVIQRHGQSADMIHAKKAHKADLAQQGKRDRKKEDYSPENRLLDMLVTDLERLWFRIYGKHPGIVDAAVEPLRDQGTGAQFRLLVEFMCEEVGITASTNAICGSIERIVRQLKED
jgi:hypothetical protein